MEKTTFILRVNDILQGHGTLDYKGLDTDRMYNPLYALDNSYCYIYYDTDTELPEHSDIIVVTEQDYITHKEYLDSIRPKSEVEIMQEKITEQEQAILELTTILAMMQGGVA